MGLLAGAKAAAELRDRGFDGRVVLLGAEPDRPYERPPLSKDYLRGETEREKAYVHPEGWYAEYEVQLMTGTAVSYERIPYFSDQYDVGMEYSGFAERWDQVVLRGDPDAGEGFLALWLSEGRVLAGMNVNVWDVNQHVQELIRSRRPVDPRALADPETPLDSVLVVSG